METTKKFYIGPAGWSYKDWIGTVYTKKDARDKLQIIARYFNCIEINSSFYRIPSRSIVSSWCERIEWKREFLFTVKVWQRFTHERKISEDEVHYFLRAFEPLLTKNRLGAFLIQFPWSFKMDEENVKYLHRLSSFFRDVPAAVELRHGSWNSESGIETIKNLGLAICNIDQPQIANPMPPTDYATIKDLAYIRLHGRNARSWFAEGAGRDERYNYLYSTEELIQWKERASEVASKVNRVFIITNNHFRGQAIVNALQIKYLLEGAKQKAPGTIIRNYPQLREICTIDENQSELEL